ncbi:MAG: SPOR domain-containing protein [Ignavibacteria bacterium]|nr:SPOR domain-containing protein [Ignavibacteria bacterium]
MDHSFGIGPRRCCRSATIAAIALLVALHTACAQDAGGLSPLMRLAESGRVEELRKGLADIEARFSEDPGYMYLAGRAEQDGDKAIQFYQTVANAHPSSEWADEALYRLYQYSYAIGAYSASDRYLSKLETEYPGTPLLRKDRAAFGENGDKRESTGAGFSVQVAAYDNRDDAEEYLREVGQWGYTAELRPKIVGGKRIAAIWVGRFATRDEARNFAAKLKARHNTDGLVVRR